MEQSIFPGGISPAAPRMYAVSMQRVPERPADTSADAAPVSRTDRVELAYADVVHAVRDGYLDVDGGRLELPDEVREAVKTAWEEVQAKNQGIALHNALARNADAAKQQAEAMEEEAKQLLQALKIFRRMSKGGVVPHQDEMFLMEFSETMYLNAKMLALMAEEHKKHKTALEEEPEEEETDIESRLDHTRMRVEASISTGGDAPAVDSVSVEAGTVEPAL